jgi:hypothetical protein
MHPVLAEQAALLVHPQTDMVVRRDMPSALLNRRLKVELAQAWPVRRQPVQVELFGDVFR